MYLASWPQRLPTDGRLTRSTPVSRADFLHHAQPALGHTLSFPALRFDPGVARVRYKLTAARAPTIQTQQPLQHNVWKHSSQYCLHSHTQHNCTSATFSSIPLFICEVITAYYNVNRCCYPAKEMRQNTCRADAPCWPNCYQRNGYPQCKGSRGSQSSLRGSMPLITGLSEQKWL